MKKSTIICMILMLIFCAGINVSTVYADTGSGDFEYTETADGITITGYTGTADNVTVPSEINGTPVIAIGEEAFKEIPFILSIKVSEGIKTIGDQAFYKCDSLEKVELPKGLQSVGNRIFGDCWGLTKVSLPEDTKTVWEKAFYNCSALETIRIPDSVERIADGAFSRCFSLKKIDISEGCKYLGNEAFLECRGLETIKLPDSIIEIGDNCFTGCSGLRFFDMPLQLKKIGAKAFWGCSYLDALYVSPQIEEFGDDAFLMCSSFRDVYIRDAKHYFEVTSFGKGAARPDKIDGVKVHIPYRLDQVEFDSLDFSYDGQQHIIEPTSEQLNASDYTYDELSVTDAGTYTLTVKAANPKACYGQKTLTVKVTAKNISKDDISVSGIKTRTYTGKAQTQKPVIKCGDMELTAGKDYDVTYSNNKSVGTASAKVSFKGNYAGSDTLSFKIKPAKATVSKLTAGKKKLTVKMSAKPSAKGATRYQIAYKQKGTSKWKYTTTSYQTKTIKSLKKGKRYYVKARAYKTVSSKKYYGAWSQARLSSKIK